MPAANSLTQPQNNNEIIERLYKAAEKAFKYFDPEKQILDNAFNASKSILASIDCCCRRITKKKIPAAEKIISILEDVSNPPRLSVAAFHIELLVTKYIQRDRKYNKNSVEARNLNEVFTALEDISNEIWEIREYFDKDHINEEEQKEKIDALASDKIDASKPILRDYQKRNSELLIPLLNKVPWTRRYYIDIVDELFITRGQNLSIESKVNSFYHLKADWPVRIDGAAWVIRHSLEEYAKYVLWKDINDDIFFHGKYPPGANNAYKAFEGQVPASDQSMIGQIYADTSEGVHANKAGVIWNLGEDIEDQKQKLVDYAKFLDKLFIKDTENLGVVEKTIRILERRVVNSLRFLASASKATAIPSQTRNRMAKEICYLLSQQADISMAISPFTTACIFEEADLKTEYMRANPGDQSVVRDKIGDFLRDSVNNLMVNDRKGTQDLFKGYIDCFENRNDGMHLINKAKFKEIVSNGRGSHINALEAKSPADQKKEESFVVGLSYHLGLFVIADEAKAKVFYASAGDDGGSLNNLAYCEEHGSSPDPVAAYADYQKASALGSPEAFYNLGRCLENGNGVSSDTKEAIANYSKAAEYHYQPAIEALERLGELKK